VKDGGHLSVYLKGYLDGRPSNHNSREGLAQFLEDEVLENGRRPG
jgi:hypothetical protein